MILRRAPSWCRLERTRCAKAAVETDCTQVVVLVQEVAPAKVPYPSGPSPPRQLPHPGWEVRALCVVRPPPSVPVQPWVGSPTPCICASPLTPTVCVHSPCRGGVRVCVQWEGPRD